MTDPVVIQVDGPEARVSAPYDERRVEIMRQVPGRRWDPSLRMDVIPGLEAEALAERLRRELGDQVVLRVISPAVPPPPPPDPAEVERLRHQVHDLTQEAERAWAELADAQNQIRRLREENDQLRERASAAEMVAALMRASVTARAAGWAEQALGRVSAEQRESLWRRLVKAVHPDVGGSAELTRDLLDARPARNGGKAR